MSSEFAAWLTRMGDSDMSWLTIQEAMEAVDVGMALERLFSSEISDESLAVLVRTAPTPILYRLYQSRYAGTASDMALVECRDTTTLPGQKRIYMTMECLIVQHGAAVIREQPYSYYFKEFLGMIINDFVKSMLLCYHETADIIREEKLLTDEAMHIIADSVSCYREIMLTKGKHTLAEIEGLMKEMEIWKAL